MCRCIHTDASCGHRFANRKGSKGSHSRDAQQASQQTETCVVQSRTRTIARYCQEKKELIIRSCSAVRSIDIMRIASLVKWLHPTSHPTPHPTPHLRPAMQQRPYPLPYPLVFGPNWWTWHPIEEYFMFHRTNPSQLDLLQHYLTYSHPSILPTFMQHLDGVYMSILVVIRVCFILFALFTAPIPLILPSIFAKKTQELFKCEFT